MINELIVILSKNNCNICLFLCLIVRCFNYLISSLWYGSASAFFVTQTLRGLSRDGRTVIASIHQPSSEVFELFDRLYLLSGGKTVYFGQASEAYEARNPCF